MVVLALSVVGNMTISMYAVALNLQMLLPIFTTIPRIAFIFVTMAIMIPMAIYAAAEWETSLENFLSIIGYWAGCFNAILIEEMVVFRRMDFSLLPQEAWNVRRKLPTGLAAVAAVIISLTLVIPGMDAAWYTGPIGEKIGDIGFEAAFVVTAIAYFPARRLEIRWMGSPAEVAM
jgi:purine-cytosine permease-like protein